MHWGARFAPHAFLGTPRRAYLVGFTMTGEDLRALARRTDYEPLRATLAERFERSRAIVIDAGWANARVLPPAERVTVTFPKPLHDCVHGTDHPWACCASDCGKECCEKSLGSPTIALSWTDGDETLTFHYGHTIGTSWLDRRRGDRTTRYACLTDARGALRVGAP